MKNKYLFETMLSLNLVDLMRADTTEYLTFNRPFHEKLHKIRFIEFEQQTNVRAYPLCV